MPVLSLEREETPQSAGGAPRLGGALGAVGVGAGAGPEAGVSRVERGHAAEGSAGRGALGVRGGGEGGGRVRAAASPRERGDAAVSGGRWGRRGCFPRAS